MKANPVAIVGFALAAMGCGTGSGHREVQDIGTLARTGNIPTLEENEVEATPSTDVGQLLDASIDVEGAVKIALLNNRELRARLRTLGVARGALLQAGVLPNPTVEVELLPERNTTVEVRVEYDLTYPLATPRCSRVDFFSRVQNPRA